MITNDPAPIDLGRLTRLERRVQWLTTVATFLALAFFALVAWQLAPKNRQIDARRFVLRDAAWSKRGELGFLGDGSPLLRLNNRAGKARFLAIVRDDGSASLLLTSPHEVHRARLSLTADGRSMIQLAGADGRTRFMAEVPDSGPGRMELRDENLETLKPLTTAGGSRSSASK